MLIAKRLTAQQAVKVWETFYHAHGADVMARAYGWEAPDARSLRSGEKVWAFYAHPADSLGQHLIGWAVCTLALNDPDDNEALIALGVFPAFQRRGYRTMIRDWICAWAKSKGADYAKLIVYKDNEEHYRRAIEESKTGPWTYAGDVWYPEPGHGIFVRDLAPEGTADAPALEKAA